MDETDKTGWIREGLGRESWKGEGFSTGGMEGKSTRSGLRTQEDHAVWLGGGSSKCSGLTEAPVKTESMPCDLLVDPTPRQAREMWGTGWDMRLVLGYVDLEYWSRSLRLDPVRVSSLWVGVMNQSGEICVTDILFLSVSELFFLPSLLPWGDGQGSNSASFFLHVFCPSMYP